jgi:outer membrane protein assembly factor BamB
VTEISEPLIVTALDPTTGTIAWSSKVDPPPTGSLVTTEWSSLIDLEDDVVVASDGEFVVQLDAATGTVVSISDMLAELGALEPDSSATVSVVLTDGAALAIGADHVVRVL